MPIASYNDFKKNQLSFRHIFLPEPINLVCEVCIAVVALCLFNISNLSNQLLIKGSGTINPVTLVPGLIRHTLAHFDNSYPQKIALFVMWAIVGGLCYIVVFEAVSVIGRFSGSIAKGKTYARQYPGQGLYLWLASLRNDVIRVIVFMTGSAAVIVGALVCFGLASQELINCLASPFPKDIGQLALALIAAFLSVRIIVLGLCLLSSRFRGWYAG